MLDGRDEVGVAVALRDQRAIGLAHLRGELQRHAHGMAGAEDEIEILGHLLAGESRLEIARPQRRGLVLHHRRGHRAIVEHLQNVLPGDAALARQRQALGHHRRRHRDHQIDRELCVAGFLGRPEIGLGAGEGGEQRLGVVEGILRPGDEAGQRTGMNDAGIAGDRRTQIGNAARLCGGRNFGGGLDAHGAGLDQNRSSRHRGDQAGGAEQRAAQGCVIGQGRDDRGLAAHGLGRRSGNRNALRTRLVDPGCALIECGHGVAGLGDERRHRQAHLADPDESDIP